jgi:hypothetical protein
MRAWQWAAHCSTFLKQNAGAFLQGACLYHVICNYGGFFSTVCAAAASTPAPSTCLQGASR